MQILSVTTSCREEMIDITARVKKHVQNHTANRQNGALVLYCPHTTCGLTINEGAEPDVVRDMTAFFGHLAPRSDAYRHAEGNSDAHIKASLMGSSLLVLVEDGTLRLGTWQSIYLYEGDGPRNRNIWLQWLPGEEN